MYHRAQRLLLATLLGSTAAPIAAQSDSILDIVRSNEDFSTLATIVRLAGLIDELDDDNNPITVFAPPNSAFDDLPPELVAKLLDPDWQPQLQDVLLYHTLTGAVFSADLVDGPAPTGNFQRDPVTVATSPSIMINDANVIVEPPSFDIPASNGVIHVIDAVLTPPSISRDVADTAIADGRLGTLVTAIGAAGLVDALKGDGPFTVFAPTDEAFAKLPSELLDALLADTESLTSVLLYHVVEANVASYMLSDSSVDTLEGSAVEIDVSGDAVMLNNAAKVIDADLIAKNGIVHVIDEVLIPPGFEPPGSDSILDIVKSNEDFSTLALVVEAAGLDGVLDDDDISITVFAPPNSAFDDLPQELVTKLLLPKWTPQLQDVLLYHTLMSAVFSADLVDGPASTGNFQRDAVVVATSPSITINDANVIVEPPSFDIPATNGVIHVIDAVLTPPSISRDVADTAGADGRLGTLVIAIGAAGLVDALKGDGPFTVFAPTDEAFAKLPSGLLDTLLADTESLTSVLLYHVVADNVASYMLSDSSVDTLEGSAVEIDVSGDAVMLNNAAKVIDADFIAKNGILHVIDEVLIPPDFGFPSSPSKSAKSAKSAKSVKSAKQGKIEMKIKKKKKKKRKKRNGKMFD